MKRLLLLLALTAIVGTIGATSVNFQNAEDLTKVSLTKVSANGAMTWAESSTGTNNYVHLDTGTTTADKYTVLTNVAPAQYSYAAATLSTGGTDPGWVSITFFDANKALSAHYHDTTAPDAASRYEVKISGGTGYIYRNGTQLTTIALAPTPYYIGFGVDSVGVTSANAHRNIDDIVWGESENKHVLGMPESTGNNAYALLHDTSSPGSDGLVFEANNSQVSATLSGSWARGNATIPPGTQPNESVQLVHYITGTVYSTNYTDVLYNSPIALNINSVLITPAAPYGLYCLHVPTTSAYSNCLVYRSRGATITFNADDYSPQDTATMAYSIEDAYWDSGSNDYRVDIISGTTGETVHTQGITLQTGTDTYTFEDDDLEGVYYAILISKGKSSGSTDVWMAFDYAELNVDVVIHGYVNDAETGLPISGANVNITQGDIIYNGTTPAAGNYTTVGTGFQSGATLSINATAALHNQYYVSWIPLQAKSIPLNITLVNSTPAYTGLGIGGVARDGVNTSNVITKGYGRPISGVTVYLINTSNAESYTKTASMTGWYLCDEGTSCSLTNNRPYDVWGEKLRYNSSPNYTVVASG